MIEPLAHSLVRLEGLLAESGAAIVPVVRPGLDGSSVTSWLGELGLTPTAELATWFAWHDGAGAPGVLRLVVEIVPGGEFYDLASLCDEYRGERRVADQLGETPGTLWHTEQRWPTPWFPLLRLFGKGYLAADLSAGPGEGTPLRVLWHDAGPEERSRVAWPSIGSFVDDAIKSFESGVYWVDGDGIVQGPSIDFPQN